MRWIKYQIVQSTIGEEDILVNKKIGYSDANLAIAQIEAYNGEYTIEEDDTPEPEIGVDSGPVPFVIHVKTITSGSSYSLQNVTYQEILDAYNSERELLCKLDSALWYSLREFSGSAFKFTHTTNNSSSVSTETLTISSNGTVSFASASLNPVKKAGDTMTGILVAQNNANYTVKQVRNIFLVADGEELPAGSNGDICLVYVP